jgi:hypothetical protein
VDAFPTVYRVYDWDWGCDCRGGLLTDWEVTLAGMGVAPGEVLHLPDSGYEIGSGYQALVLYATEERITLKYTREDHVVWGYTIHVENVCVEPGLLALYREWNDAGRGELPALHGGQPFGRARGDEIGVAIRDTGRFMDPRSREDWWQAKQALSAVAPDRWTMHAGQAWSGTGCYAPVRALPSAFAAGVRRFDMQPNLCYPGPDHVCGPNLCNDIEPNIGAP